MNRIDLDNIEDIVAAKAAIERNIKQGDVETVAGQVRGERLAVATFKEIRCAVKECINRYNSTASRERVLPLKITADNIREFAVQTADETGRFSVSVDGAAIRLTRREFELLRYLVENRNRVLSRDRLLERVWGYDRLVETRSVDVHVGRLRGKLGVAGRQIETVVGLGYRFVE